MIFTETSVEPGPFEAATGWALKPEGACRGDVCVPLPERSLEALASRLNMPLVAASPQGPWALGPETRPQLYLGSQSPELRLPDWKGAVFDLRQLRGSKVLLVAWAPW